MPDDSPMPDRRATAVTERLAVVEVKVDGLAGDAKVIRQSLHDVRNEMQVLVRAEEKCGETLVLILEKIKNLPEISHAAVTFTEMRPGLNAVIAGQHHREGLAAFGRRFAMIVAACAAMATFLGLILGGLVWLAQHLKPI